MPSTPRTLACLLVMSLATLGGSLFAQVDCAGVLGGTALPGTPCDDGDPLTFDDIWYPNCYCQGQCEPIGQACDDNNAQTTNDVLTGCGCVGTCFQAAGEPCDDGDPWTTGDMIWPECYCWGYCAFPPGTLCDDGDPLTTGEFLNGYCQCVGGVNLISGNVFLDLDLDGVFGGADLPLAGRRVDVGAAAFAITDAMGDFSITVPSGSYLLSVVPGVFEVPAQAPQVVNVIGEGLVSGGHVLALNATSLEADLAAYSWQTSARPGFMSLASVHYWNHGTAAADGTLTLTFDPQQTFVSSDGTLAGNTVTWDLTAVAPGGSIRRTVVLETPASVPLGTVLVQRAQVTALPPDAVPGNDLRTVELIVGGSYDPNDKSVWPAQLTPDEVAAERPVEYLIRFQNTGTYLAENVRITDQLPAGVDAGTFQFLGSSHPCETTYAHGIVELEFNGIMLPDSTSNEPESHGFVRFQVTPRSTLMPGDSVWNRAYIYFDFNEAIVTNAATFRVEVNTAVPSTSATGEPFAIWPNPASDRIHVDLGTEEGGPVRVSIMDQHGRLVSPTRSSSGGTLTIPLHGLAAGIYSLRIEQNDRVRHQRFLKFD